MCALTPYRFTFLVSFQEHVRRIVDIKEKKKKTKNNMKEEEYKLWITHCFI